MQTSGEVSLADSGPEDIHSARIEFNTLNKILERSEVCSVSSPMAARLVIHLLS